jgi:hypothetical protein
VEKWSFAAYSRLPDLINPTWALNDIDRVVDWLDRSDIIAPVKMIDLREFAGAVLRSLELAGSGEDLRLRYVDREVPGLVCNSFGGGPKPEGAAK